MNEWRNYMEYLQKDSCFVIPTCKLCGGDHKEEACPFVLTQPIYGAMQLDSRIKNQCISVDSGLKVRVDNPSMVGRIATDAFVMNHGILSQSNQLGKWADASFICSDQYLFGGPKWQVDKAPNQNIGISLHRIETTPSSDPSILAAQCYDIALFKDKSTEAYRTCEPVHLTDYSSFESATHLYRAYQGDMSVPTYGSLLKSYEPSIALCQYDQIIRMAEANKCQIGISTNEGAVLPWIGCTKSVFEHTNFACVKEVDMPNCVVHGALDVGCILPPEVAFPWHKLRPNDILYQGVLPEKELFSEIISRKSWHVSSGYMNGELVNLAASRVADAVYDAVACHDHVEGDLIVQVVVVMEAQTGTITQIGRISPN